MFNLNNIKMKKLIVLPLIMASVMFSFGGILSNETINTSTEILHNETETFKVYGNCGMCKNRIESSLKDVDGIKKAEWNVKTKMMTVTFDPHKITLEKIKETIASVGHDTDDVKADNKVYNGLPGCCQFDRAK